MKASRALPIVAAMATLLAHAQTAPPTFAKPDLSAEGVRSLAAACAMCHGQEGRPVAGSSFPALAGRPARDFVAAMEAYRQGRREGSVMAQIAKGYGEAEVAALGEYFAKRAP